MSFILRMAWRDSRASRRRLLLYSSTIILGIAALVAVGSFGANLRKTVGDEPRRLLGADLRVGLDNWPNRDFQRAMDGFGAVTAREKIFQDKLSYRGFSTPQAVQVIALDGPYPFYGEFTTEPADGVDRLRRGERVVLLDPSLAKRLHVAVGDSVNVGSGAYIMAGTVRESPGDSSFSLLLTSRAYLAWSTLPDAPDIAKKSVHGDYRLYFKLPAGADSEAIAAEIKSRFTAIYPVATTADDLGKKLDKALVAGNRFFSLVVFVALFLGAIGVASTLHVYIQERLRTVAILRCVGASAAQGMGIYLCQAAALGVCGSVGGAIVGVAIQFLLPDLLKDLLPIHIEVFLAWKAVAAAMTTGFLICMVFALLPLLAVRRTSPLAALRSDADDGLAGDPLRMAVWALIVASVLGFAWWEARDWRVAFAYSGALVVAFAVFAGAARLISTAARRSLPSWAPYPVRQGVANLYRPRNRTSLLLLSLGLGLFLILTVYLVRSTLLRDMTGENTPNLLLGQIADTDLDPVLAVVKAQRARVLESIPVLDVALESVNGKPWTGNSRSDSGMWSRSNGPSKIQASYREKLLSNEEVIQGKFTGQSPPGTPVIPVSVLPWMIRKPSPLHFGDEAVWRVEGVPIRTRIAGVRRVQGVSIEPIFPLIFPDGPLDAAPKQTLLLVRARTPADSAAIQRSVGAYPSVRIFDIASLIETVQRIFNKVALVVDFIAFFTIATGMVILAATVMTGRHQRARETVLLRVLGASRRQLRWVQLTEYSVLGILSAVLGGGMAMLANLLLARFFLKIPAGGGWFELSVAAFSVVTVAVITGVFADRGLANLPPLEILREEG